MSTQSGVHCYCKVWILLFVRIYYSLLGKLIRSCICWKMTHLQLLYNFTVTTNSTIRSPFSIKSRRFLSIFKTLLKHYLRYQNDWVYYHYFLISSNVFVLNFSHLPQGKVLSFIVTGCNHVASNSLVTHRRKKRCVRRQTTATRETEKPDVKWSSDVKFIFDLNQMEEQQILRFSTGLMDNTSFTFYRWYIISKPKYE